MSKVAAGIEAIEAVSASNSTISQALMLRLSAVMLLAAVTLLTTSCGTLAQANGVQKEATVSHLNVYGRLPVGKLNEAYNAVFAVGGGSFPYYFSVKTGTLPPGISLNPTTGRLSGQPTATGTFSFEVIVTDSPRLEQGSQIFSLVVESGTSGTIRVSQTPPSATLSSNQKEQFTATVSGTSNTGIIWSATAGLVDGTGLYTAPKVTSKTNAVVTATSTADSTKSASASITINPPSTQSLQITTGSLSPGQQGSVYAETMAATGGATPYHWSISAGAPPPGVSLNLNGEISGVPTSTGTSTFSVTVTDSNSLATNGNFSVNVVAGSNFDGPAELPRTQVSSAMANTPAPGTTHSVAAGGNVQAALNNANCGDTISLQAGATFSGLFTLPAKSCDSDHWIIIRTSSPDSALPAEGQRLTPCYAGVASLPGRPSFNCSGVNNVMAKVSFPGVGAGPFLLASGANHYRLLGLEITRPAGTGFVGPLIYTQNTASEFIIIDRSWLHGTAQDETVTGVDLMGMTNAAVIDSSMTDFHCTTRIGACTDSKAIAGGVGSLPGGPYKISNNFLEAAGENILLGGGPATTTPADIEIIRNHFYKPVIWQTGRPGFMGGKDGLPFVVKNLFELKNAQRVLLEGNIMEYSWGGFTQAGDGIVLTPKDQYSLAKNQSVCPLCQVTDITIRYSTLSHTGGGMVIANSLSQNGGEALAGGRYSIHDVTVDDINAKEYSGDGTLFEIISAWSAHALNNVTINHITGFSDPNTRVMGLMNLPTKAQMTGFVMTNNIVGVGTLTMGTAGGGITNCAVSDVPITILGRCFQTYTFTNNAIIGSAQAGQASKWPVGNYFAPTAATAQFVNFNNANGGNYELQTSSPFNILGTDGKPLGADMAAIEAAIAGVY
jgi:Putative Ig domain